MKRNYIRNCRKKWALTQGELAQLLGHQSAARARMHDYERGQVQPSVHTSLALEVIFGLAPGAMFPRLYEEIETAVMGRAARLYESLEGREDQKSERKRALLRQMIKRARADRV